MLSVIEGKTPTAGPFDREKLFVRSLERLPWHRVILLWGLDTADKKNQGLNCLPLQPCLTETFPGGIINGREVNIMSTSFKAKDGEYRITIPISEALEDKAMQGFIDLLRIKSLKETVHIDEEALDLLAEKITKENWEKVKGSYVSEIGH